MDPLVSYKAELAKEKAAGQKSVPGVNLLTDQPGGFKPAPPTPPQPTPAPTTPTPPPQNVVTPPPMPKRRGKVVLASVIFLLLAIGGAYWYIQKQGVKPAENTQQPAAITASSPYEISDLKQMSGESEIGGGEATNKKQVSLEFAIPAWKESVELVPQVEVRPVTENFTGEATSSIDAVQTSSEAQKVIITAEVPADGAYHWQARVVSPEENGEWLTFSGSTELTADFVVDTTAPAVPSVVSVGSVQYSNGVSVNEPKPGFVGKAEPGSKITLELQPEGQKLSTTADTQGNWSVQANEGLTAASYTAALTAADLAGNTTPPQSLSFAIGSITPSAAPATPPAPAPEPARDEELADTGQNPLPLAALGLLLLLIAAYGLRRGQHAA